MPLVVSCAMEMVRLHPGLVISHQLHFNSLKSLHRWDQARKAATAGLEVGLNQQLFHNDIATACLELGELDEAFKAARAAFDASYAQGSTEQIMAGVLATRHPPAEALQRYREDFARKVGRAAMGERTFQLMAAQTYWMRGGLDDVNACFRAVSDPMIFTNGVWRGIACRVAGEVEGAIELQQRMAKSTGVLPNVSLALALLEAGQFEAAARAASAARTQMFRTLRILMTRGGEPAFRREVDYLERLARECRDMAQGNPRSDWSALRYHLFSGRLEKALPFAERALENDDPYHDAYLLAARAAVRAGVPERARTWLERGLQAWSQATPKRAVSDEKQLWMWQVHPDLEPIRNDPKWADFWARVEARVEKLYR